MCILRQTLTVLLFSAMIVTGIFVMTPIVNAATIADQYSEIRSEGLIFANICNESKFPDGDTSSCACRESGRCSLEQVLQMFVNVSYLVLALSGSAALIAFVYGGFEWILSAGHSDRVERGKQAIVGAAIGLAIVFGAYAFINLLISVLIEGAPATTPIEETLDNDANKILKTE